MSNRGSSRWLRSLRHAFAETPTWVKVTAAAAATLFVVTTYFMDDSRSPNGGGGDGGERDVYANQPARGMFAPPKRAATGPDGRPLPPDQWPRTADGRRIFQATHEWQEVPDDCVVPPGLHVEMNMQTSTFETFTVAFHVFFILYYGYHLTLCLAVLLFLFLLLS